ncbi:hypothetical protein CVT25_000584 [Psilocybe cyanescens]|uniref:Uncharacterized protein n=1 Tax=Psilocybe cyanescens TaxID=93625 RepID=A0A409WZT0_PSICY|nr:hypothetical protein CVT25_000584 [Psilocybe cyanescens]
MGVPVHRGSGVWVQAFAISPLKILRRVLNAHFYSGGGAAYFTSEKQQLAIPVIEYASLKVCMSSIRERASGTCKQILECTRKNVFTVPSKELGICICIPISNV